VFLGKIKIKFYLRSEEFLQKNIRIPRENVMEILHQLGKLNDCIEFIDMNKDDLEAKKNFSSSIKRCDEIDRKIRYNII